MSVNTHAGLPVWRSLLYVPVNVSRFVDKAHTRGADAIILDIADVMFATTLALFNTSER